MQDVVIPWRDMGDLYRRRHFNHVVDYYGQYFNVVIGDVEGEFSRSGSRNAGVAQTKSDLIIIIDADNHIPVDQIFDAMNMAKEANGLIKPFKMFGYLTERSTEKVYKTDFTKFTGLNFIDPPQPNFNGGAYVMHRDAWDTVGGFDEGFVGWGAEDDAFHIACAKELDGVQWLTYGMAYHLFHPAERVVSKYNYDKLNKEYVNGYKSSRD